MPSPTLSNIPRAACAPKQQKFRPALVATLAALDDQGLFQSHGLQIEQRRPASNHLLSRREREGGTEWGAGDHTVLLPCSGRDPERTDQKEVT